MYSGDLLEHYRAVANDGKLATPRTSLMGDLAVVHACPEFSPQREALEQYISGVFSAAYNARILGYLPLLFSLERENSFVAALGLQSAALGPLLVLGRVHR